jgi:hypothetical protein
LQIKTSLTIKPSGFYMHAKKRHNSPQLGLAQSNNKAVAGTDAQEKDAEVDSNPDGPKLGIYYGAGP